MAVLLDDGRGTVITLTNGDAPANLPLEVVTAGQAQVLSDGTQIFQPTGKTPSAIAITGTLYANGVGGSPLDKMDALYALWDAQRTITLRWNRYSYPVFITRFKGTPEKTVVRYELDLFWQRAGAGAATSPTPSGRTKTSLDRMGVLAPLIGPQTSAAWASVLAARQQAGM